MQTTSPRDPTSSALEGAGGWVGGEARSLGLKGEGAAALGPSCLTLCPEDRHSPALWLMEMLCA